MELFIFARFHARAGQEKAVEQAIADVIGPTRREPGCLRIHSFRSARDPQLFYIHSQWVNEAAFDQHTGLPHTVRFVERVEKLIDHAMEVTRTTMIG
jgi:quinol monooxygenase YgiN